MEQSLRKLKDVQVESVDKNRHQESIKEIIDYLNFKTGRKFTAESRACFLAINKRLDNGITVQDFKSVIDYKTKEWINTKFEKYLRPNTLFFINFNNYLEESKNAFNDVEPPRKTFTINGYDELLATLKRMKYSDYLTTDHWLHFKEQALIFFRNNCQLCGSDDYINIHHKTYANRGRETFNDVVCLCRGCHGKFHDK